MFVFRFMLADKEDDTDEGESDEMKESKSL